MWVNPADGSTWVFEATDWGLNGLQLQFAAGGSPFLRSAWKSWIGATSAVVANNVLYSPQNNLISALDPTTGDVLWQTSAIGLIHWESPIVVNGNLYITDQSSKLTAFGLPATGAEAGR